MLLTVQPGQQNQCFRAIPKAKNIMPKGNKVIKQDSKMQTTNIISAVTWLLLGVALFGGAVNAITTAFKNYNKSENTEVQQNAEKPAQENTVKFDQSV